MKTIKYSEIENILKQNSIEINSSKKITELDNSVYLTYFYFEKENKNYVYNLNSSNKDEIILDPFMGSGTTAVVAKKLGRKYIGYEINKEYIGISEKLQNLTQFYRNF